MNQKILKFWPPSVARGGAKPCTLLHKVSPQGGVVFGPPGGGLKPLPPPSAHVCPQFFFSSFATCVKGCQS